MGAYPNRTLSSRGAAALGLAAALSGLPALAAPPGDQPTLRGAVTQPLRDLNIMRTKVAEPLQTARASPYDVSKLQECQAIRSQIAQLDGALGPDVDQDRPAQPGMIKTFAASAVRSAVKLPFNGVVRRLSGADAREQVRQQSIQAGIARRAFLKGVAFARCNSGDVPYLDVAAAKPATGVAPPLETVELRPEIEARPSRVQVAQAPSTYEIPAYAQEDRAEPAHQASREPVYGWVASDTHGAEVSDGR